MLVLCRVRGICDVTSNPSLFLPNHGGRQRVAEKSTFAKGVRRAAAYCYSSICEPEALLHTLGGHVRRFLRRSLRAGRRVSLRDIAVTRAEGAQTRRADKDTRALWTHECEGGAARPTSAPTACIPTLHGRLKGAELKSTTVTRPLELREQIDDTARRIKHQRLFSAQRAPRRASRVDQKGRSNVTGLWTAAARSQR